MNIGHVFFIALISALSAGNSACSHLGLAGGALAAQGSSASHVEDVPFVAQPNWQPGDRWLYSDGYGLEVFSRAGPITSFRRLDVPRQWFSRNGFLRESALSPTTLRQVVFRTIGTDEGGMIHYGTPLTFRREYQSGGQLVAHSTSWTVEGRERISVPAGTFDCVILVWRTRNLSSNWTGFERWWYAPEAGHYARVEYRYGEMEPRSRVLLEYQFLDAKTSDIGGEALPDRAMSIGGTLADAGKAETETQLSSKTISVTNNFEMNSGRVDSAFSSSKGQALPAVPKTVVLESKKVATYVMAGVVFPRQRNSLILGNY